VFHIWVLNDPQVEFGRTELERFAENPEDPGFNTSVKRGQQAREARHEKDQAYEKRAKAARRSIDGAGGTGLVSSLLMVMMVLVAVPTQLGEHPDSVSFLFISEWVGPVLPEIRTGEIWRLFTPIFLHFGFMHLFFNLWWLWDLGGRIEHRRDELRFLLMVLVIAASSNLLQYAWSGPMFGGMSGVVYGLLGYIWAKQRLDPSDGLTLSSQVATFMMGWLVLCMTGLMGPVANAAHVGGLVAGLVWGWLSSKLPWRI